MSVDVSLERLLIEHIVRHFPSNEGALQVIDVDGRTWELLGDYHAKLQITVQPAQSADWRVESASVDVVVAYDTHLEENVLGAALKALRPGGRLIVLLSGGRPDERYVRTMQEAGYKRIVAYAGAELDGQTVGVLVRGEKPQTEARAVGDDAGAGGWHGGRPTTDMARGRRFVYLLVQQTPNKPLSQLQPHEVVTWYGAGIENKQENRREEILLVFSNLTRAVEFMQPAIVDGYMREVNQIAKFAWDVVKIWPMPVLLNPSDEILKTNAVLWLLVDSSSAETPDE